MRFCILTGWVKGKPSEAYVIRNGCGLRFEQKFQAEVLSHFLKSQGSPESRED